MTAFPSAVSNAIEIRGVSKRFGGTQALGGVDLQVRQGEFFGLLGPNGAGKTTLISILAGLVRADTGQVRVMGHDVRADFRAARRALGVVPQELVFDPFFSVRETLRLQSGYFGIRNNQPWIDEVMGHLDLQSKADANMRSLSGGMKRRVLVAQALVHKPPVIVLDEPTAGVDVELRQGLWRFIRGLHQDGHTIVLTTHYLEEAEQMCERIAMLKQGRVVALDSTASLLRKLHSLHVRVRIAGCLPESLRPLLRAASGVSAQPASAKSLADSSDSHAPGHAASQSADHVLRLQSYAQLEEVLADLRATARVIEELELLQPDLEDVFLEIMHR